MVKVNLCGNTAQATGEKVRRGRREEGKKRRREEGDKGRREEGKKGECLFV